MSLNLQQLVNRLSFRQLQVFQTVYQVRGYKKAAESLGLTQPAVSSQINKLEQALEQPLFEYIGRKLYCTDAGERVAEFIEQLFTNISHLQNDLYALKGELSGDLKISAVNTAQPVVPYLIKAFRDLFPTVNVNINIVNRAQALERLEQNNDDLVIMAMVPSERPLAVLPFLDNELIPIVPPEFSPVGKGAMTPQRFLQQPLILREPGSGSRLALEQHCLQHRLAFESHIEFGSNDTIKHAVIAGIGVAVVPKLSVVSELKLGLLKTIPLKGFPLRRSWCLVYPKGKNLTPVAQAFLDYVQQNLAVINQYFSNKQV